MPEYKELKDVLHIIDLVMSDEGIKHKGKAIRKRLKGLPTEDVEKVRHGEWIWKKTILREISTVCSECGQINHPYNYCPNCGAKMDLKEGEGE